MKLLALCVIFVTLQHVLSTNYISGFNNHDWICDYKLDTANDIEVKTPKRSVEDKNKNNMAQKVTRHSLTGGCPENRTRFGNYCIGEDIDNGSREEVEILYNKKKNTCNITREGVYLFLITSFRVTDDKGDDDYYVGKGPGQNFVAECVVNKV